MENKEQWSFAWVPQNPATAGKPREAILREATWKKGETVTVAFLDGDTALQKRVRDMGQPWTGPGMANLSFDFLNHNNTDIRIRLRTKVRGRCSASSAGTGLIPHYQR